MSRELEIRISGSGGQGLILGARILSAALMAEGLNVAQSQSYEPTSRGGMSRSDLVVSDGVVDYPLVTALDYLVIMDQVAARASTDMIKSDAVVVIDSTRVAESPPGEFNLFSFPLTEMARKLGNVRIANMIALGVLTGASAGRLCSFSSLEQAVSEKTPERFRRLNLRAVNEGYHLVNDGEILHKETVIPGNKR